MNDWSIVLENDLRWREAELASLLRLAINNSGNALTLRAILRANWAILYAHFEGFTKFCWDLLFDHIQSRSPVVGDLSDGFLVLALQKRFKQLRADTSPQSLWNFFSSELPVVLLEKAAFTDDCRLVTESNLWPNIFDRECAKVGIQSNEMQQYRQRIQSLVARRNEIAHGKDLVIKSISEYRDYEYCTLMVMHDLAVQVVEILDKEAYMKPVVH